MFETFRMVFTLLFVTFGNSSQADETQAVKIAGR
jgi:hypothetical protein